MENSSMMKFMNAIDSAKIDKWEAVTAIMTHFYNNDTSFNIADFNVNALYNFARPTNNSTPYTYDQIVVKGASFNEIHEVRFGGSLEQVKKFIEAYGISLTDDQYKILVNINTNNYTLKPVQGDYLKFEELSDSEIDALTDKEKSEYYQALKAFKERNKMTSAVQVTV